MVGVPAGDPYVRDSHAHVDAGSLAWCHPKQEVASDQDEQEEVHRR
jgi:hypothetical protein